MPHHAISDGLIPHLRAGDIILTEYGSYYVGFIVGEQTPTTDGVEAGQLGMRAMTQHLWIRSPQSFRGTQFMIITNYEQIDCRWNAKRTGPSVFKGKS